MSHVNSSLIYLKIPNKKAWDKKFFKEVISMKCRVGFVTNSSSSSFIVNMKDLTPEQIEIIKKPKEKAEELGLCEYSTPDSWWVKTDGEKIVGWTYMDNFDWIEFLEKIGVDLKKVKKGIQGSGSLGLKLLDDENIDITVLYNFKDEGPNLIDIKEQIRDILWYMGEDGKDKWLISKEQLVEWYKILDK